ncbi:UNVERIFIED_CONTAM: hypothetical protein K2H54_058507 [Gekko kuhli]
MVKLQQKWNILYIYIGYRSKSYEHKTIIWYSFNTNYKNRAFIMRAIIKIILTQEHGDIEHVVRLDPLISDLHSHREGFRGLVQDMHRHLFSVPSCTSPLKTQVLY